MSRALHFYKDILGLKLLYGDENSSFSSFDVNGTYLNRELSEKVQSLWGRVIFYCDDVDEVHAHLSSQGFIGTKPKDAPWGERFFHVEDPDGHEISVAMRLETKDR
jgi:catechol 2,3-dioxygenase-like lactoylglutathione lyase family enzyme